MSGHCRAIRKRVMQRSSENYLGSPVYIASRVCLAVVIASRTSAGTEPLRKHCQVYAAQTNMARYSACGNRIATIIGVKHGTSVDLQMALSVSRATRSATRNQQPK